jgi:hypothetical protein
MKRKLGQNSDVSFGAAVLGSPDAYAPSTKQNAEAAVGDGRIPEIPCPVNLTSDYDRTALVKM